MIKFIKFDWSEYFNELNEENNLELEPKIEEFAEKVFREIKGKDVDMEAEHINWPEFRTYRSLLVREKEILVQDFEARIFEQRR